MSVELLSKSRTSYGKCPHCAGTDIRQAETERVGPHHHFHRSWFCRTCWWDTSIKLRDDTIDSAGGKQASADVR